MKVQKKHEISGFSIFRDLNFSIEKNNKKARI